jgi:hypothetical protein
VKNLIDIKKMMKITVVKGRKEVQVNSWGSLPLAKATVEGRVVYIPNGFEVETFSHKKYWLARTRVTASGQAEYQFVYRDYPRDGTSDWKPSPTAAYREANQRLSNLRYTEGSNGAIIIGVTYPNLQEIICNRFADAIRRKTYGEEEAQDDYSESNHTPDPTIHTYPPILSNPTDPSIHAPEPISSPSYQQQQTSTMNMKMEMVQPPHIEIHTHERSNSYDFSFDNDESAMDYIFQDDFCIMNALSD